MLPDLRFVIGAVIATALLGRHAVRPRGGHAHLPPEQGRPARSVASARLRAREPASHLRYSGARVSTARSPTYRPIRTRCRCNNRPNRPDLRCRPPAAAAAQPPSAQPASPPRPASDADTVDERAVVDPPLPLDNDAPAAAANPCRPRHRRSLPPRPRHRSKRQPRRPHLSPRRPSRPPTPESSRSAASRRPPTPRQQRQPM